MVNYDNFSSTFAASRKNMKWPEIEYFIENLKIRMLSGTQGGIPYTQTTDQNSFIRDSSLHSEGQLPQKIKILDVGCGSGRLFGELQASGIEFEYLGIDSSSGMIDEAKNAYPEAEFRVLDMLDIDKLDGEFDVVFFLASFHHLSTESERILVLQKLKNILAKNGTVYMTNWNLLSEENMKRYKEMYRGSGDFDIKIGINLRYYHGFTLDELENLFNKTDFQVVENRVFEGGRNIVSIIN